MTVLSDVLAHPRDMDRRLRYAETVARTDPDHAELIRLQIAHDRLAIAGEPVRDPTAVRRVGALVATLARRLSAGIGESPTGTFIRRGFAEILAMSGAEFLARGADLSGSVPWRGAVLSGVDAAVAADLARSPLSWRSTGPGTAISSTPSSVRSSGSPTRTSGPPPTSPRSDPVLERRSGMTFVISD